MYNGYHDASPEMQGILHPCGLWCRGPFLQPPTTLRHNPTRSIESDRAVEQRRTRAELL